LDITDEDNPEMRVATRQPSKQEIALVEMTAAVEEIAEYSDVELDIPSEQVALMAIKYKLLVEQVDALMLTRADHDARFSVMFLLLRSGFTTDQIYAAYYVVDQLEEYFDREDIDARKQYRAVLTKTEKDNDVFPDWMDDSDDKAPDSKINIDSVDPEIFKKGLEIFQGSLHDQNAAMVASWFATFEVFEDLSDIDMVMDLLAMVVSKSKHKFGWSSHSEPAVLTKLYVLLEENCITSYDDILQFLAERSR
jgi:hypothetical protein